MTRALTLVTTGAFLLVSCREQAAPAAPNAPAADERTLEALRREVDRANRGEAVGQPPDAVVDPAERLAGYAASDDRPRELKLPAENATRHVGALAVKVAGLRAGHSVRAGRMALTTEDAFLEVRLATQNVGEARTQFDLSLAEVRDASGQRYAIASDVQRGAGTRQLARAYGPDERVDVTLFFEVPTAAVGHGLSLVLPAATAPAASEDVVLPLD